ncbi:Lytic transglycosylase catalytic (plasmid) [Deinococcus geothermalis DSM 11300]|uniref:Lytic transglycosylase catalytic n=1 Tax=Deinococcus geothermalis (strain DSM 11300 / CIP 105573 / AG-3a) TaxID=319795 RepID=A8ZR93_DEIGD|nr:MULTISPECIES: lytic transglycosylase domain-containing protein [Deinococcus]ABW35002.1 Lytic transglycosylase catalytic [Deinococcus geothermalis DSM 11300]
MKVAALGGMLALGGAAHAACTPDQTTRLLVERTAATHGLPPFLLTALVLRESGFCPDAVSRTGAIGYGQLMPATARGLGVNPHDPQQNLWGAAKYLRQQWDTFKNWRLALAAYNAGPSAVIRYGGIPPYQETQAYVRNVLGTYTTLSRRGQARLPALAPAPSRPSPRPTAASVGPVQPPARPAASDVRAAPTAIVAFSRPGVGVSIGGGSATPDAPAATPPSVAPEAATPGLLLVRGPTFPTTLPASASSWGEQASPPPLSMLVYRASPPSPAGLADARP